MKLKICFLTVLTVLAVGLGQAEDGQAAKKASAKKKPAPPAEVVIPSGATLVEPGTYTFTDAQGKKWIYRKTPFGIARAEDKPADVSAAPAPGPAITATEDGDSVRFERPGPFGPYRWQKKKSELSDDERSAWERSSAKPDAATKAKQE
jgi:hypothetical protein